MDDNRVNFDALDVPHLCGGCGYNLAGLPGAGRCPECGGPYADDELVLFGWAGKSWATVANATPGRMWFLLAANSWGLLFSIHSLLDGQWGRAIVWLASPILISLIIWRRYDRALLAPAPVQLRLSSRGQAQKNGAGEARIVNWMEGTRIWVEQAGAGRLRIRANSAQSEFPTGDIDVIIESKLEPQHWESELKKICQRRGPVESR